MAADLLITKSMYCEHCGTAVPAVGEICQCEDSLRAELQQAKQERDHAWACLEAQQDYHAIKAELQRLRMERDTVGARCAQLLAQVEELKKAVRLGICFLEGWERHQHPGSYPAEIRPNCIVVAPSLAIVPVADRHERNLAGIRQVVAAVVATPEILPESFPVLGLENVTPEGGHK